MAALRRVAAVAGVVEWPWNLILGIAAGLAGGLIGSDLRMRDYG
jgi:hypothetical protein